MNTKRNFLIVGLGSMGKRRIRNLLIHDISPSRIFGFDLSPERCDEVRKTYHIKTIPNFDDAVSKFLPDVLIISTPPHLHMQYCRYAISHNLHFFVEISTIAVGYPSLIRRLESTHIIGVPSCTYRFHTPIVIMKKLIDSGEIGNVEAFLHHCGQYLPDWHPWESYKNFYVSKAESSALKEMFLYELCWIAWLTSTKFEKIVGVIDKVSDLDMPIPDVYGAYLSSKSHVVGSIFIDVISRKPFRTIRILGSEGTLEWNLNSHSIEIYRAKEQKTEILPVLIGKKRSEYAMADETMYENEIRAFLDALDGKKPYPYTFAEDRSYFNLLGRLEEENERK